MALSPLDIHNKEFNTRMRGYDQDQVNDFLDQIIKDYTATLNENEQLKKELADSQEKVKYFTDLKDALNQSIIVAQEAADRVKGNAQKEADIIQQQAETNAQDMLTDATEKSNRILSDASEKAKAITIQTEDLKRQTRIFRQRLQVMMESQLEVVKSPEWKQLLASSDDEVEIIDTTASEALDNQPIDPIDSEPEPIQVVDSESEAAAPEPVDATTGETYTEIVFPEDNPQSEVNSQAPESESN